MKTNLAFVLEPTFDTTEPEVLNAEALDRMLRAGAPEADRRSRTRSARGRRVLVSLKDNHSNLFRPFRVY